MLLFELSNFKNNKTQSPPTINVGFLFQKIIPNNHYKIKKIMQKNQNKHY